MLIGSSELQGVILVEGTILSSLHHAGKKKPVALQIDVRLRNNRRNDITDNKGSVVANAEQKSGLRGC